MLGVSFLAQKFPLRDGLCRVIVCGNELRPVRQVDRQRAVGSGQCRSG